MAQHPALHLALHLTLSDFVDNAHFTLTLSGSDGQPLASHPVAIPPGLPAWHALHHLPEYLEQAGQTTPPSALLDELGRTLGPLMLAGLEGPLLGAIKEGLRLLPVKAPAEAAQLLSLPLELLQLGGRSLHAWGLRLVTEGGVGRPKLPIERLRVLVLSSLPDASSPHNLRGETTFFHSLPAELLAAKGTHLEVRVAQYGATRNTLRELLDSEEGWDVVHLTLRGVGNQLMLETKDGGMDRIPLDQLVPQLRMAQTRIKLLTLCALQSAPGLAAQPRASLGLPVPAQASPLLTGVTSLPEVARTLAEELDCAVLSMRYPLPLEDGWSRISQLYRHLLVQGLPLSQAVDTAFVAESPGLAWLSPSLSGSRALSLKLEPPPDGKAAPKGELLDQELPRGVDRFEGRLRGMMRASLSLASGASQRGVLFYGMPGAGKTTCGLELVRRHERSRFPEVVWWSFPLEGGDQRRLLVDFLRMLEQQLFIPDQILTRSLDDATAFAEKALSRLKMVLSRRQVLLALDNLEVLLDAERAWLDPRWALVCNALLEHDGQSRLLLMSRRIPATLKDHAALRREPVHTLSLDESLLLIRSLPNLSALPKDEDGQALLLRTLEAVQGHPLLLELAEKAAADPARLENHLNALAGLEADTVSLEERLQRPKFLSDGQSDLDAVALEAMLARWLTLLIEGLPEGARGLLGVLCRLEEADRAPGLLSAVRTALMEGVKVQAPALAEGLKEGLEGLSGALMDAGLVAERREALEKRGSAQSALSQLRASDGGPESVSNIVAQLKLSGMGVASLSPAALLRGASSASKGESVSFLIHPAVALEGRKLLSGELRRVVDRVVGDRWESLTRGALKSGALTGGRIIQEGLRLAALYHRRAGRQTELLTLLDAVQRQDHEQELLPLLVGTLEGLLEDVKGAPQERVVSFGLARALFRGKRYAEAEPLLRDLIEAFELGEDFERASEASSVLMDLLLATGRAEESLALVKRKAGWSRAAGAAGVSGVADERRKVQALLEGGRPEEALEAVVNAAGQAEEAGGQELEDMLRSGRRAALESEQWEMALKLGVELVKAMRKRKAAPLELARVQLEDYWSIFQVHRNGYDEARGLLQDCRNLFEQERDTRSLGRVYAAQADLEDAVGHSAAAAWFAQMCLRFTYQDSDVEGCVQGHHNLANYLTRRGAPAEQALAHRLAAAILAYQVGSSLLEQVQSVIITADQSDHAPPFEALATVVEQVGGVQLRTLLVNLQGRAPDGPAALEAVWAVIRERRSAIRTEKSRREKVLSELPVLVQAAFEVGPDRFVSAFQAALSQLSPEKAEEVVARLKAEKMIREETPADQAQAPAGLDPLVKDIVDVARGDERTRPAVEGFMGQLTKTGWKVAGAVHKLWAGERNEVALLADLEPESQALMKSVLAHLHRLEGQDPPAPPQGGAEA